MEKIYVKHFYGDKHFLSTLSPDDFSVVEKENINLFFFREENIVEISTCEGLLYMEDCQGQHVVCNPATDQLKFIPESDVPRPPGVTKTSFHGSGFGYDNVSGDYKLVRNMLHMSTIEHVQERMWETNENLQTELYSFNRNAWDELPFPTDEGVIAVLGSTYINANGCFYWNGTADDGANNIISFNFATKTFSSHSLPPTIANNPYITTLVDYDGHLGVTASQRTGHSKNFQVWVFKDEGWSRVLHVRMPNVRRIVGCGQRLLFLEGRTNTDGLCQLLVYDWEVKKMNKLDVYDYPGEMRVFFSSENTTYHLPDAHSINGSHNDEDFRRFGIGGHSESYHEWRKPFVDPASTDSDEDWAVHVDDDDPCDVLDGDCDDDYNIARVRAQRRRGLPRRW